MRQVFLLIVVVAMSLGPVRAQSPAGTGALAAYYVLGGEGTISITGGESGTALVRAGDAIPVRLGESSRFTNTGSAPFELFVIGVAKDTATKTQLLIGAER